MIHSLLHSILPVPNLPNCSIDIASRNTIPIDSIIILNHQRYLTLHSHPPENWWVMSAEPQNATGRVTVLESFLKALDLNKTFIQNKLSIINHSDISSQCLTLIIFPLLDVSNFFLSKYSIIYPHISSSATCPALLLNYVNHFIELMWNLSSALR